ncbi:glutaredoxin 3 [Ectothiorhodospiraceae bacterium 2226]|nr:glutaredoxin 3 [Ectothiorhodospiraceae bacterium 2226]
MAAIRIYLIPTCPFCQRAERLLTRKGVATIERIDVAEDGRRYTEMEALTGRDTVPQIFIGERHVGGYDELVELSVEGELDELLAAMGAVADRAGGDTCL